MEVTEDALELAKAVRRMVRAENRRVHESRMTGKPIDECGTRDEADLAHGHLYLAWPAKRLDALINALAMKAKELPLETVERLTRRLAQVNDADPTGEMVIVRRADVAALLKARTSLGTDGGEL